MERSASRDVEHDLERTGDELEERLGGLDEHIDDARKEAQARSEDTDAGGEEDANDDGGDDPAEFDDPDAVDEEEDEE
jgi:hypothetical protein